MKEEDPIQNPVDPEQVAANPGLLPYAHHVGSALIKPIDRGRVRGRALSAMYEQTDRQLDQIREQVELLAAQADVYGDVEPWHGSTHVAIGGDMSAVATAARAPIFFSWHMTVDTPWHNWQLCWPAWDPADYDWL